MQLYDALPQEERNYIKQYVNYYGGFEGDGTSMTASLGHILRFWDKNKQSLFNLFGGKFILEKDIDIQVPTVFLEEEMEEKFYNEDGDYIEFIKDFDKWSFEYANRDWVKWGDLRRLIDVDVLCENAYTYETIDIPVPGSDHPLRIQKGCKAIKMLAKIAKTFDLKGFEEFRLAHSMVLNQKRFKGKLCLSIHPLDYMTMSDNECEWSSCMSWQEGGDYRLGTVEMMNSPCVIVAYLKAEKDMRLFEDDPESTWSNKRWRELFVVSPELITGIKGYPFNDPGLRNEVFKWLLELSNHNPAFDGFYPTEHKVRNGTAVNINGLDVRIELKFHAMYNDFYSNHPIYFNPRIFQHGDGFTLVVSGETECMICGEDWTKDYNNLDADSLICPTCSGSRRCPECGEYIDVEDFTELEDGCCMCNYCAELYASACDGCHDMYRNNNLITIYLRHIGAVDNHSSICLCDDCMNDPEIERSLGPIQYRRLNSWSLFSPKVHQVDSKNFTLDGFHMFGYWGKTSDEMLEEIAEHAGESED